ncbi:MAG: Na+/H+ antiporter NhaC family protein [Pseudomonadota bacterium]
MRFSNRTWTVLACGLGVLAILAAFPALGGEGGADGQRSFGILSLLPPLVAIGLCILSKEVIPSLFVGTWVAGTMLAGGNPVSGFGRSVMFLCNGLGDPWGAKIVLTSLVMGGLVGVMRVGGGIGAVVEWITSKIRTARGALLATELAGLIIFFEDYVNTLVVGTSMGPITEKYRISKEKLSYIVDSTAAPVACIAVISSWIAYMVGQIEAQFKALDIVYSAYAAYLRSIPHILYNIVALILLTYVVLSKRDMGPMLRAEQRARKTGKLVRDGARPLIKLKSDDLAPDEGCPKRLVNFIVPLASLLFLIIFLLAHSGGWPGIPFSEALTKGSSSDALVMGSFGSVLITMLLYGAQRLASWEKLFRGFIEGMQAIFLGTLILIFAWGIGSAIKEVHTAQFIVGLTGDILPVAWLPLITFITGSIVSFSTGTSYGTMAVLMPIVVPLVRHAGGGAGGADFMHFMFPVIGAVFAGAVFGDHCSPISDTTIMSSMFSGSDHMDHVHTQAPYAVVAAAGAVVGYVGVALGLPAPVNLIAASLVALAAFRFLSKPVEPLEHG